MSYINGSDLLLNVGGKAVGHCTTHTTTYNSETKDRAVKPVASAKKSAGLWKGKVVTGLSISISAEGLRYYTETENGFKQIAPMWGKGQSVQVQAFEREGDTTPYLSLSLPPSRRPARHKTMPRTPSIWRMTVSLTSTPAAKRKMAVAMVANNLI